LAVVRVREIITRGRGSLVEGGPANIKDHKGSILPPGWGRRRKRRTWRRKYAVVFKIPVSTNSFVKKREVAFN
jgi:hypothetical protein